MQPLLPAYCETGRPALRRTCGLEANVEPVGCEIIGAGYREDWTLHGDGASRGLAIICEKANREGRRVYLSGQGSDEIFSDYGRAGVPIYPHSNFGGLFPE